MSEITNTNEENVIDAEYTDIKAVSEDQNSVQYVKLDWDVVVDDVEYDVVCIENLKHHITNTFVGRDDLWMYPRNEEISADNIIPYVGVYGGVTWGIVEDIKQSLVDFSDENGEVVGKACVASNNVYITRNGLYFCSVSDKTTAEWTKDELQYHPLNLFRHNYLDNIVGRKIYWNDQPAVIKSFDGMRVLLVPEDKEQFDVPMYIKMNDSDKEEVDHSTIVTDIFDNYIIWNRE